MNRAILIAVCDFLILSLLAMGSFNPKISGGTGGGKHPIGTPLQEDILDTLKIVLDQEKSDREKLVSTLQRLQINLEQESLDKESMTGHVEDLRKENFKLAQKVEDEKQKSQTTQTRAQEMKTQVEELSKRTEYLNSALEREKKQNDALNNTISELKESLNDQTQKLANSQSNLKSTLKSIESLSYEVAKTQKYSRELEDKLSEERKEVIKKEHAVYSSRKKLEDLEQERDRLLDNSQRLKRQLVDKQQSLERLRNQLQAAGPAQTSEETAKAQAKLLELSQQLIKQEYEMGKLEKQQAIHLKEIQNLQEKFETASQEKQQAQQTVTQLREEKKNLQKQTNIMAKSLEQIAKDSVKLKEQKTFSNNEIFTEYLQSSAELIFNAQGKTLGNSLEYNNALTAVAVKDGSKRGFLVTYNQTPLGWMHFEKHLRSFSITVKSKITGQEFSLKSLQALASSPDILFVPVPADFPIRMKYFDIQKNVTRFDRAILISTQENKYESFSWMLNANKSGALRIPPEFKSRKFSAKAGDIVLTPDGKILGILSGEKTAVLLSNLQTTQAFSTGQVKNAKAHRRVFREWEKSI